MSCMPCHDMIIDYRKNATQLHESDQSRDSDDMRFHDSQKTSEVYKDDVPHFSKANCSCELITCHSFEATTNNTYE